jgi:uncharacterized membrane protein
MTNWPLKPFLATVAVLQLALLGLVIGSVTSGFDIPFLRQALGFICLTFVPGMLILRLLKLYRLSAINTLLYSVGLSLATLMFLGFLINIIYPLVGISQPIAALPLIITLTTLVTITCALLYLRDRRAKSDYPQLHLPALPKVFTPPAMFLLLLPLLSVLGTYMVNYYGQNSLLLVLIGLLALIAGLVAFNKFIPPRLYSLAIVMIALALLWHRALISQYLIGDDIHTEYYFQNLVLLNSIWGQNLISNVNAMLSITMLAPVYSLILNMNIVWIDKIIHPLFFSLVPLALFQAYRKQTNDRTAFLAAFFFITFSAFFIDMLQLVRQQVAEIFFALSILLFLEKEIPVIKKSILLIVFGFSIVVSHYGLSYFYMFYLIIALFLLSLSQRSRLYRLWADWNIRLKKGRSKAQTTRLLTNPVRAGPLSGGPSTTFVMLIVVFAFTWYLYISAGSSPFNSIVNVGHHLYNSLNEMFIMETRDTGVLMAVGLASPEVISVPRNVYLVIQYLTQFFIVVGAIGLLFNLGKTRFHPVYIAMTMVSGLLLLLCIVLPYFSGFLNISRIYHITLIILAPFCILGGITIFKKLLHLVPARALRPLNDSTYLRLVVLVVLIPYFLFSTGFVYEASGDTQTSLALAPSRFTHIFTYEQDTTAVKWLSGIESTASVISDDHGSKILSAYGIAPQIKDVCFTPWNIETTDTAFIFLCRGNILKDEIWVFSRSIKERIYEPVSLENNTLFQRHNKIYDNGANIFIRRHGKEE